VAEGLEGSGGVLYGYLGVFGIELRAGADELAC
jgi:hypothetical protein